MLDKLSKNVVSVISIIILAVFTIMSIFYIVTVKNFFENVFINITSSISVLIYVLIDIALIFLFKILSRKTKINKKIFLIIALIIYVIVSVLWVNSSNLQPVDDSKSVNDLAVAFAQGDMEKVKTSGYIEKCPHQIGMIALFAGVYKLFGTTNYRAIQYLNIVANVFTIIFILLITEKLSKKYKTNKISSCILTLTFIPLILLETYVYGDYLGLAFSLAGIYFIMKYKEKNKIRFLIISSLFMLFAYVVKMNYVIITIAIIIYLGLYLIKQEDKKEIAKNVGIILIYVFISVLPFSLAKTYSTKKLGCDPMQSIPSSVYMYMGMNESYRANGWYSDLAIEAWQDTELAHSTYPQKIKTRVKELLKHPRYTTKFYWNKTISGWMDPYFQSIWYNVEGDNKDQTMENIINSTKYKIAENYQKAIVILIYGGAFIGILKNRKNLNEELMLILIIFIGGVLFHTIWEMKSRYTLPYVIMLIPASSIGIQYFIDKIKINKRINLKKNNLQNKNQNI